MDLFAVFQAVDADNQRHGSPQFSGTPTAFNGRVQPVFIHGFRAGDQHTVCALQRVHSRLDLPQPDGQRHHIIRILIAMHYALPATQAGGIVDHQG